MASPEWLEIFRGYDNDELRAAHALLKKGVSPFAQQGNGAKSYAKDQSLSSMLSASTRVMAERGLITATTEPKGGVVAVTDFSTQ